MGSCRRVIESCQNNPNSQWSGVGFRLVIGVWYCKQFTNPSWLQVATILRDRELDHDRRVWHHILYPHKFANVKPISIRNAFRASNTNYLSDSVIHLKQTISWNFILFSKIHNSFFCSIDVLQIPSKHLFCSELHVALFPFHSHRWISVHDMKQGGSMSNILSLSKTNYRLLQDTSFRLEQVASIPGSRIRRAALTMSSINPF